MIREGVQKKCPSNGKKTRTPIDIVSFFFICLMTVICELMLLELGDLLDLLSLFAIFLVWQGQYFLVHISARLLNIVIILN